MTRSVWATPPAEAGLACGLAAGWEARAVGLAAAPEVDGAAEGVGAEAADTGVGVEAVLEQAARAAVLAAAASMPMSLRRDTVRACVDTGPP